MTMSEPPVIGSEQDLREQLHPDCLEVLRRVAAWNLTEPTVANARTGELRRQAELAGSAPPLHAIEPIAIPVGERELAALAYRPTAEEAPGTLVWLHGGGWIAGTCDGAAVQASALARASGCVVLAVDYRLAPEHPFPAGLDDAYAATAWAARRLPELGVVADGRVAVGGDSSGGNLAAAVTLMARDRGGPRIDFQLLVYAPFQRSAPTESMRRYGEGYWLTATGMEWFWDQYLASPDDAADPLAAPLLAESLAGLPPALIVVAGCDVLRDEGLRYGERLRAAGVPVTVHRHARMVHGFLACAGVVEAAWDGLRDAGEAVGAALRAEVRR
jgi:acetyl esterase